MKILLSSWISVKCDLWYSIPGVIEYENANIQLLDLPGIIEGAAQGKGRGRQVIAFGGIQKWRHASKGEG